MVGNININCSCDKVLNYVCGCLFGDRNYIHMMEENLEALENTMQKLKERRDDLSRQVGLEEDKGLQRLHQVQGWFSRVDGVESQVNDLLEARLTQTERLCMFRYCSSKLMTSCKYGKDVSKKLKEVQELLSEGEFKAVAELIPASKVVKKHIQTTVGLDAKVKEAWDRLMKVGGRTLGLHGMGGVGKTTLLAHINNKFIEEENESDVVIWVVVSKDLQYESIQDQILRRLCLDKEWEKEKEDEKASHIYGILNRKNFVLLLDDLWSEVDLNKIGVPPATRENRSKIVFTTRLKEVCIAMKVDDEINVDCLSRNEAWELFQILVGETLLKSQHDIPTLARTIVEKCCGLPLALNVIGKAMAIKETVQEWRHAVDLLKSPGHKFPGMEENIFSILKFSYDCLKEEKLRMCFRYCYLFPEDYEIEKQKLIEYWICEGFIVIDTNSNEVYEDGGFYNQGYDIMGELVRAHLLIDCELKTKVKMHDVIRDMALWIESDFGKQKETICVKHGAHGNLKDIKWDPVRQMSQMHTQIAKISISPNCPSLLTLILPDNQWVDISGRFFQFMPALVVLDLSGNWSLVGLPEVSNLGSLRYLNLSHMHKHIIATSWSEEVEETNLLESRVYS